MLYVCVMGVLVEFVFSVCIVTRGTVGGRIYIGKNECFRHADVCVLCASCATSHCCILHDLQFVNASQGCKRRPYGRGILQSLSQ